MLPEIDSNDSLLTHLKDQFQLDWSTERKACDSIHKTAGVLVFTEDALEQLRSTVSHSRLLAACRFSKRRDPFLMTFSKPFPPAE